MADVRQEHTPAVASASVCLDGALLAEIEQAEAALEEAKRQDDGGLAPGIKETADRVLELHDQAKAKERRFVFAAIGARQWSDLLSHYPPSKDQRKEGLDHDPDPFSRAAMAASASAPTLTDADVEWLSDNLSLGQYRRLWTACLAANVGVNGPKAQPSATATLLASGPRSTSAQSNGAHARSSLAES
jgi:hypothetical protein